MLSSRTPSLHAMAGSTPCSTVACPTQPLNPFLYTSPEDGCRVDHGRLLYSKTIHKRQMTATTPSRWAYALETELSTFRMITTAMCKAKPSCCTYNADTIADIMPQPTIPLLSPRPCPRSQRLPVEPISLHPNAGLSAGSTQQPQTLQLRDLPAPRHACRRHHVHVPA